MPLPRETRTDDLDLLPLSERKRMLIYPDIPSKGLNVKQVIPGFNKEWPGLPKGVKFDPSDEELLWHLLAEIGKGVPKRHPFIHEFIVSLNENDALGNVHPQFLPGVKQDGSISYFFHRKVEMCSSRKLKRLKKHDNSVEICWHSIVKLNIACLDGIHKGSKEVLNLYLNPVNGGNPVKTPWLMHQYHIGIDGAEEDVAVSKIFYEMRSKQDVQDSRTDSVDGFVAETVAVAAPLQVAPEFHEGLHVESVSADTSIQVSATHTPAEMTIKELSQKEVDHGIGSETNVEHVGYLKSARSQKHPTTWLEKAITNHDMHSEGTPATDQLPLLESSCETAAEINTFSTSAKSGISHNDQKECVMVKRTDGFLANVGDFGISINNSNYDKVIGDDTSDSNDAHISMEKSCPEKAPEHVLQKNVVDKMFKTPAYSLKGKPLEETESKIAFQKNSSNWVNISAQSALPIKTEPKYFEDTQIGIPSEKFSNNRSSTSASSGLLIKVKPEPFEEAEGSIILEKYVDKFTSFSQSSGPVNSSNSVNFCISKTNIQEKIVPHFYISEEGIRSCNLSRQAYIPEDLNSLSVEISSNKISSLDELNLETTGLINQHPEKDDNGHDGLLTSNDNSQVLGDSECHLQINVHAGEPQSNSVSSSSSPNVKYEHVESSLLSCSKISLCNTRGHPSLIFENKSELYSDSPLDILDHVPLKYRFGISVSDGDVNVKSGNISEAPVTPGRCSFGSVNTEECISFSRRKRKKTATNSVERAMEEDAPGLLKVLLDRGVQVEEIKLYGDPEDSDLPETSSSEGSFEELETVMTKLFSERSSFLRLTLGRTVKGSRAIYCLASLISLIEQARYLHFRRTPVDWGWCRDLQSFIFVFQTHNRIVLERPEYGYATYFFELVDSLPIDWQIKRLVKAMKLTNCCRTILLENRPIIAGEDLSEGEARVLEAYGWARNTGFGTLLNYVDRVVHDRRDVMCSSEWRAKIGKMLMSGYDGGRMVLANIPEKVLEYLGTQSSEIIKMEL